MKRISRTLILILALLALTTGAVFAAAANYRAHLSGRFEVPAVVDTQAQGQAIFQLSEDGTQLSFKLTAANLDNIFMAHIHLLPASGTGNGPIVVWLYPNAPVTFTATQPPTSFLPGRFSGVLAEGVITAADLRGPLAGMTLAALVEKIESGQAYVNIHTSNFDGVNNTGPGDFPGGEIHGLIEGHDH